MSKKQQTMSADQKEENLENMAPKNDPTIVENAPAEEADLQELQAVSDSLDELSSVLDTFEARTDNIIEQLKELLHSNREIRQQLAVENAAAAAGGDAKTENETS